MNAKTTKYTVGEVAELARVTVRTLHHYDEIGLLVPSDRSEAGYRLYEVGDLERLFDILLYRELGFALEEVRELIERDPTDRLDALIAHRERLEERVEKTRAVLRAVDRRIEALKEGREMDEKTAFEAFEEFDHGEYEDEARERWGDTDAYRESNRRTKDYSPEQWKRIKKEMEEIESGWAELLDGGHDPTDPEVTAVAERARLHIDRWFYPCSHRMHVGLAEMYETDPRFKAHYEERREGLATYVAASIRANAGSEG